MKVAVATPEQAGPEWDPLITEWLTPAEIRAKVHDLLGQCPRENEGIEEGEIRICTMNRTVLDLVTSPEIKNPGPLSFEDVVVWQEGRGLVPLLDLHSEDFLVHSHLGTIFERGLL